METLSSSGELKKSILASAEIKFLIQATEDEKRFTDEVSKVLKIPVEKFDKSLLDGHFGNPIAAFRVHLRGEYADKFGNGILSFFKEEEKKKLLLEISNHIDKHGSLYLRIDKQSIFDKRLIQSQIDPVRIKLKLRFKAPLPKMIESFWSVLSISK
tara:strand:+ start:302 stop:769 length:468 start_codon:yes stop_codon:yes gene_type:complete